jgi:Uma2 family endonuclease
MKVAARAGPFSFEDYLILVKEGQKGDLLDGVIYLAPPEEIENHELCYWLMRLLANFVEIHDLGQITVDRITYRLDNRNAPEPDLALVRKEREYLILRKYVDGPPDLAVEVVAPESVERDYGKKRKLYERFGVPEYWIIDEFLKKVTMLRLNRNGKYQEVRPKRGILHSQVVPGFWFRIEWLWQETRPGNIEATSEVLGKDHGHTLWRKLEELKKARDANQVRN